MGVTHRYTFVGYIRGSPPSTFRQSLTPNQGYDFDKVCKGALCFSRVTNDHTSGSDQRDRYLEFLRLPTIVS